MPDHALECLSMGRNGSRVYRGNDYAGIGNFAGKTTVTSDNANYLSSRLFSIFYSPYQIDADIFLLVTPTDRKHKNSVLHIKMAAF